MKTNELIYSIKELLKDHTDDSLISNRHILHLLNTERAMLLRQLYSARGKAFDVAAIQSMCLEMELVDKATCGITTDCYVLRSKERIPEPLSVKSRNTITYIGPSVVAGKGFDIIKSSQADVCVADPYTQNTAFVQDGYIYVTGKSPAFKLISCIEVRGIFEDPSSLEDKVTCNSCNTQNKTHCFTIESTYPVPGHLVPVMTQSIVKMLLATKKLETVRDKDNNSVPE